jgi:hypothetical protein
MNTLLKVSCLAIYLLAAAGSFIALPLAATSVLQTIALILLALHVLELPIALSKAKLYQGPPVDNIALTLLFGLLHWLPLTRGKK